jgi:Phage integrase family
VVIGHQGARDAITRAVARAELHDVNGQPLRLVPHDFRRLFATEAVNGGLPIHIAAKLLGHLDLNTTKGYVAVYPEQVVRHFQAHLVRRRARRPSQEYREPTTQEWDGFQQHFRRRRMALGGCYRPYGTDCPHEHACVRCPMLRMDPRSSPGCSRSNTTPTGYSPRQRRRAGKERRPDWRTPWPISPTRRHSSSGSRPTVRARRPRCG